MSKVRYCLYGILLFLSTLFFSGVNVNALTNEVKEFSYTGNYQEWTVPFSGYYEIELWGAQGGNSISGKNVGGYGAYTKGIVSLPAGLKLYIYVGESKSPTPNDTTFNGASASSDGYANGGATDVRLVSGEWNNFDSLKSRIMVAAGGGGAYGNSKAKVGAGGGLTGKPGGANNSGGTQTSGGLGSGAYTRGSFGYGGNGESGGGGYYGGGGSPCVTGSGGGSSFISGHLGCDAILETSVSNNIKHSGQSVHYSGYYFTDTVMIDGDGYPWTDTISLYSTGMPTHDGKSTMVGNTGNGYAKITYKGANVLKNLSVINATVNPLSSGLDYDVYIDNTTLLTTIKADIVAQVEFVNGLGEATLEVGKKHYITVIDKNGNLNVVTLNVLSKPFDVNVTFDEVDIEFDKYKYDYEVNVGNEIKSLHANISVSNGLSYTLENADRLRVGKNRIKLNVTDGVKTFQYTFLVYRENLEVISKDLSYTGTPQEFVAPSDGYYQIELWGASGDKSAYGGYTKGVISLSKGDTLYFYLGKAGTGSGGNLTTFNNGTGTSNGWNGGGATDVRLVGGDWQNFESLKSRIMVAGGGGTSTSNIGGAAGGLTAYDSRATGGGTQVAIGKHLSDTFYNVAKFGIANGGCTGGNGYYPGGGAACATGSGGGSSFISGHLGCNAIDGSSTDINSMIHTGQSVHYSGYYFTNTVMIDGKGYSWTDSKQEQVLMPNISGGTYSLGVGHSGNGQARIKTLSDNFDNHNNYLESLTFDKGILSPAFDKEETEYTLTLDEDDITVYLEALSEDYDASVIGDGEINVTAGGFNHKLTVTSPAGDIRVININIQRNASTNSKLKDILVNGISIENFDSETLEYNIEVPYYYSKIHIEGIKENEYQKISGNGLQEIKNNQVNGQLLVVSEDGKNNTLYKVNIIKEKSTLLQSITFKELNLSVDLELNKFNYDLELPITVHSLDISTVPYYEGVDISVSGNKYIGESSKTITVTSSLEGLEPVTYTFNISFMENPEYYGFKFPYTGNYQTFIAPISANYIVELWGAEGTTPAYGAYTKGTIFLNKDEVMYVYVGKGNSRSGNTTIFNGGTGDYSGWNGGGATDVRLVNGNWNEFESLKSRIMVAAGGGSASGTTAGPGGGLVGYDGGGTKGGTQNSPGERQVATYSKSYFGIANGGCTGGNGFYPGGGSSCINGAGGGSSYISGHTGVNSIAENSTSNNIIHTGQPKHYSGKQFVNTMMIDGKGYSWSTKKDNQELMPNPNGGYYPLGKGNSKDGYAIIQTASYVPNDNYLDNLVVRVGEDIIPLDKTFEPWELEYTVNLDKEQSKVIIEATTKDVLATVSGDGNQDIPPVLSDNEIIVTAQDGSTRTYIIHFNREADNDPHPNDILVNRMPLYLCKVNPNYCNYSFDSTINEYEIDLPYAVREVELEVSPKSAWQEYKYYTEYDFNASNNNVLASSNVFELSEESTTVYVEVISEDKSEMIVYTYTFNRDVTGNNNLESITITNPNITIENFDSYTYEYYLTLPTGFSFDIEAVPERKENVKVEIQGNEMTGEPYKTSVTGLVQGMNNVIITVTAENGDTKTYILHVYKGYESDVLLNNLDVVSGGNSLDLTPIFDNRLNDYSLSVGSDINTITINASAHNPSDAIVSGTGTKTLKSGVNEFQVVVKSKTLNDNNEYDENVYNLTIYKDMSSNANIANITIDGYTMSPVYEKSVNEYYVNLNGGESSINVNVTMEDSKATYTVRGNNNLNKAVNEIVVTGIAENKNYVVYKIYAFKEVSNNNYLSSLTYKTDFGETGIFELVPGFDKDTLNYEINVDSDIRKIEINAIKEHSSATIKGNGVYYLNAGSNIINIEVIAENNDTKIYSINVVRAKDDDTNLLTIENNQGSQVSKSDTEADTYIIDVQYEINAIEIKGIPLKDTSVVSGNGIYNLVPGENIITLRVTSEANTYKDYIVKVVRDLSNNDDLEFLYVREGGLQPNFNRTTIFYDILVPNSITNLNELNIEAITEDKDATYEIVGNDAELEVGVPKQFTIVVTAPNKIDTKVYTVNVTRQEETLENLGLESLTTNRGDLTPTFSVDTLNYEISVNNEISDITVEAQAFSQDVKVLGTGTYKLNVGKNLITVFVVSNETGIQRDYQIVVTRKKSSDATLSNLVVSGHTLSPTFNSNTFVYSLTTSKEYLTFTTIKTTESDATYVIENNTSFKTGNNEVKIIVTAPDGETTNEYIINANKTGSKNNNLASLEVVGYDITPNFHKGVTFYTANVPNNINSIMINALAEDVNASISGDGLKTIKTGENYFDVVVTSETNVKKTYTILVTKDPSDNNYLGSLFSSDGIWNTLFVKTLNDYEITVPYDIQNIEFYGSSEDALATVIGLDTYDLDVGENNINISVVSESGLINVYNIKVIRENVVSAFLSDLSVADYSLDPIFNKEILEYYVTVDNEVTSLDLTYVLEDKNANVNVVGNSNFVVGMNEVHITVSREIDEDNVLENDYIIYVNRQMSTNNYLSTLYLSEGRINPDFDKETLNYSVSVPSNIDSVIVYANAEDKSSKIISGTGVHNLNPGENIIDIKVRSSVGVIRTYTVNITREKSSNNKLLDLIVKKIEGDVISPTTVFDPEVNSYEYNLDCALEYVIISVINGDNYQTVSGVGPKELNPGNNIFKVVVTAQDGTVNTITLNINNPLSSNNYASMIVPSSGILSPQFDRDINTYSLELDEVSSLSFDVTLESSKATVTGHEIKPVNEGSSVRNIIVTAEDGSERTYTINVNRPSKSNALLESLSIDGYEFEFDPNTFTYNIQVSRSKKTLLESEITAVPKDSEATVNMMGDLDLVNGMVNVYVVEVIAKDGYTTQEYKLNVTRDSLDYTLRSDVYKIVRSDEETYTEDGKTYTVIDEDYVIGIEPDTNSETFINNFLNEDKSMLHVYNLGEVMISEGNVGTSYKIKLESEDYVYDELVVIVRGDLTKDGKVNITDQAQMISYIGKVVTFDKYQTLAADITKDGKVNITDQAQIISYIGKVIKDIN